VTVQAFSGSDASGAALGQGVTTKALLPGETEDVDIVATLAGLTAPYAFYVQVDGAGAIEECVETNNGAAMSGVVCPTVF
jgi:hypothetical protein